MKYYHTENASKPIKVGHNFFDWLPVNRLFNGGLRGVFATADSATTAVLDAQALDGSSGITEITADEYSAALAGAPREPQGSGSPVGNRTPQFINQLYHDTEADAYWRSTGLTSADWAAISNAGPELPLSFNLPSPAGVLLATLNSDNVYGDKPSPYRFSPQMLTSAVCTLVKVDPVLFPGGTSESLKIDIFGWPYLASISFPFLIGSDDTIVALDSNTSLASLDLAVFEMGQLRMSSPVLTSLDLPAFVGPTLDIECANSFSLVTVNCPLALFANGAYVDFSNCALDQASVDLLLARGVASELFVSGDLRLDGGTNSPPSSVAEGSDYAILVARGVTVTVNS